MNASMSAVRASGRTSTTAVLVAVTVLASSFLVMAPAQAIEPPFDRGIDDACRESVQRVDRFPDVTSGARHAEAISCLWAYGIAQGQFVDTDLFYNPHGPVSRQQMASFVARMLAQLPGEVFALPGARDDALFDDSEGISPAHIVSVNQLTDAGIVEGFADGTYRGAEALNRAQMASFIIRSLEEVTDEEIPRSPIFEDVSGTHEADIEKLATIGVTVGRNVNTYAPHALVTRAQLASFVARSLDYLAALGLFQPLAFEEGAAATLGLTEIDAAIREDFDRVTFTLEGDERAAGFRIQYVDEARAQGSGNLIEVEGEAVIRVILTGMAIPPDLDEDLADAVTELIGSEIALSGLGIVEVVVDTVFEGQQQVFIGTTGRHDFTVGRADEPQRVFIDVEHP